MRLLTRMEQLPTEGRICIYGAGGAGADLRKRIEKAGMSVALFIDTFNDGEHDGCQVLRFDNYLDCRAETDAIVVASTFEIDISRSLRESGIINFFLYKDTRQFFLARAVCDQLGKGGRFTLLDIGARDPLSQPFWASLDEDKVRFYGFEPDVEECDRINAEYADGPLDFTCYPIGLWSEKKNVPFYFCRSEPENSSMYPINFNYYDRWQVIDDGVQRTLGERMRPVDEVMLPVDTLDNWKQDNRIGDVDFAKLDTQGGELEILKGGWTVGESLLGMIVEAAFVESYAGRPLFADLNAILREKGFQFFDFYRNNMSGRLVPGANITHSYFGTRFGIFSETDMLYFRDPIQMEREGKDVSFFTADKLFKLVALADTCSQVYFAFELLLWGERFLPASGDTEGGERARLLYERYANVYRETYPEVVIPMRLGLWADKGE